MQYMDLHTSSLEFLCKHSYFKHLCGNSLVKSLSFHTMKSFFPSLLWKDSTVLHSEPWRQTHPVPCGEPGLNPHCWPHECYFGWSEASRFNIWNWKIGGRYSSRNEILILHDPAKPKCKPLWWHRTGLLTSIWQPPVWQNDGHHLGFLEPGVTTFEQEKGREEGLWIRLNLREQHGDCNLHSWFHLVLKTTWNEWLRL